MAIRRSSLFDRVNIASWVRNELVMLGYYNCLIAHIIVCGKIKKVKMHCYTAV